MKTCFSGGKLRKQFGNPPFLRELPITNPPISEQFFNDPSLCPNFKNTPLFVHTKIGAQILIN